MAIAEPFGATDAEQDGFESKLPAYVFPSIVALAFTLRAIMALRTSVMFEDGPHFLEIANRFSSGDVEGALAHPYHPLYSAATALANLIVGDMEIAAVAVSVFGGTLAVAALFVFLRDVFDAHVAAFGAFLFAVSPYSVRFTADIQSEGIYLAFFVTGLALLIRGVKAQNALVFLAAGISTGFAYLARPEGAGLVLVGVVLIAIEGLRGNIRPPKALASCFALCTGALAVAAPYLQTLANQDALSALSGKKSLLRTLGLVDGTSVPGSFDLTRLFESGILYWSILVLVGVGVSIAAIRTRRPRPDSMRGVLHRGLLGGLAFAIVLFVLFPRHFIEISSVVISTLRPEVALLLAVWMFASVRKASKRRDTLIAIALPLYLAVLIGLLANYGYLSRRHVLPLVPFVLGYAGLGALILRDLAIRTWPERLNKGHRPAVLAALAVAMFLIAAPKTLHDHREDVLAQRFAAEWLGDQELRPGRVASNKRRTGYYAERRWFPLTVGSELRSFEALARERVRYIVVDDRVLGFRDDLEATPGFDLRELHRVNAGGRTAMVYELLDAQDPALSAIGTAPPSTEIH